MMSGRQIKEVLKERKLTQSYIANNININKGQLSRFLNGKGEISKSKYFRLLNELNIKY